MVWSYILSSNQKEVSREQDTRRILYIRKKYKENFCYIYKILLAIY